MPYHPRPARWRALAVAAAWAFSWAFVWAGTAQAQPRRAPIIDVHVHAQDLWAPPGVEAASVVPPGFLRPPAGIRAAQSTADLQRATLAALDEHRVVKAVVSGRWAREYQRARPGRILASPLLNSAQPEAEVLRQAYAAGHFQALAEFMPQYAGLAPNDPALVPYFAMAEDMDIPVGLHVGLGSPGAAYTGSPGFRMAVANPLLLEEVLVRHPRLRLYVAHAGWPQLDAMLALLYAHPQVYVDIGVINWYLPVAEFHRYLKALVDAGFSQRIMFGSDQMVWPDAIGLAIRRTEEAPFLDADQRRDIMCRNAMRFFRFDANTCDG